MAQFALVKPMGRTFSAKTKRRALKRAAGRCECGCGQRLAPPRIRYDHRIPWEISHDSSLANCQVLALGCDHRKTYGTDIPAIAKVKRQFDRHHGIAGPGHGAQPMPCGARSRLSKTFFRGVQPRLNHSEKHALCMKKKSISGAGATDGT
jgi:5-methylcytosine-specific restriction protein A